MLVAPGNVEDLSVLLEAERYAALAGDRPEAVGGVDVLDARNGREFEAGFAGVGVELQRAHADDGVVGDDLRGREVALEVRVLHELDVAETGEAFAADRVTGGVDAALGIDPGKVVNRVGILVAGQPPYRDASGIAVMLFGVGVEFAANPGDDLLALRVGRLRHAFGRHAILLQRGGYFSPGLKTLTNGGLRSQLLQVYTRHRCSAAMTLEAVLLDDRQRAGNSFVRAAQGPADEDGNDRAATQQERSTAPVTPICELSNTRSFHRVVVLFYAPVTPVSTVPPWGSVRDGRDCTSVNATGGTTGKAILRNEPIWKEKWFGLNCFGDGFVCGNGCTARVGFHRAKNEILLPSG